MKKNKNTEVIKSEDTGTATYKQLNLKEKDGKWLALSKLNGIPLGIIAEQVYACSEKTLIKNLSQLSNHAIRQIYRTAELEAMNNAVDSLKRQSEGYTYVEKEYKNVLKPLAEEFLIENKEKFIHLFEINDFKSILSLFVEGMQSQGMTDMKIYEKFAKPDRNASLDLLKVLNEDKWDLDGKHKKIEQTKIVVHVEGMPQRRKQVEADYIVESK